MKVEVISKEKIKPSSPTPHHLKTYSLSFLDQLALPIYFPLLLYYSSGNDDPAESNIETAHKCCSVVKKSLAKTLTKFYTLAGKIIDDRFVECNDDGVDYLETEVINCELSQLIQHPNIMPERRKKLLPFNPNTPNSVTPPTLLSVQVNCFNECGGIVIGLCIFHKLADASTLVTFINDWANIARGIAVGDHDKQTKDPSFSLQPLFPQRDRDSTSYKPPSASIRRDEPPVTKKFVFEGSRLADLKRKGLSYENEDDVQDQYQPTRVEAVSALLWRCIIDMDQAKNKEVSLVRDCIAAHAVNMRSRIVPPLPPNSFGNMTCLSVALHTFKNTESTKKNDQYCHNILAGKIRESMKKIDGEYVKQLQSADTFSNALKIIKNENSFPSGLKPLMLNFTSWCRFPVYEANFGWGKPIWASICTLPWKNMVLLMDTSSGDGIEAWVSLSKEDMYEFERHEELLGSIS